MSPVKETIFCIYLMQMSTARLLEESGSGVCDKTRPLRHTLYFCLLHVYAYKGAHTPTNTCTHTHKNRAT